MPTFNFRGRSMDGKAVTGKRLAQSAGILSGLLLREGITPVSIEEVRIEPDFIDLIKGFIRGRYVSPDELGLFSRQMYALLKTGVPITIALRQLAENSRTPQMTEALYSVVENLEGGRDLVTAMQDHTKIFSPIMISMLRVGQDSGRLDEAFLRLNQYLELEAMGMKKIKAALRYPIFVVFSLVCAIVLVNLLVIPTFTTFYTQANIQLPAITRMMIAFSNFMINHWFILIIGVSAAIGGTIYYFRTPQGKYNLGRYQLKIPGFGNIIRRVVLLRFAQAFAITIESGIPLLEGLTLVARSINNAYAEREILNMAESIRHGKNLTQSAASSDLFTTLELQMLAVSEETGQLSQMLEELASFYRREVDYDIKKLNDIIEPTLIIILALVVLFLALTVYLPIWDMVRMSSSKA